MDTSNENKVTAILTSEYRNKFHVEERMVNKRYPAPPITRTYLWEILHKFETTSTINDVKLSGRPKNSDDKKIHIITEMVVYHTFSTDQVASTTEVSRTPVLTVF